MGVGTGWKGRWGWRVLLAIGIGTLCFAGWPLALAHLQAIAVLKQVSHESVPWIVGEVAAEPISTEDIQLATSAGPVHGRLYFPVNLPNAPAMIVLHGVHHLGIDEPRLEAFAAAIASCGIRVLTPELPAIKDYQVNAESIRVIGESAQWFAGKTGGPVGVMGLSFAGGLALLATANPVYQPSFKFVVAVGSQDSMVHVAQYYLTGREQRPDGTAEVLPPHEYGALVLEYEHLEDFVPAGDVAAIRTVLREHLYEDQDAEKAAKGALTPQQALETAQLMNSTAAATRAMLAHSNGLHAAEMAGLSPDSKLAALTTPVYLLHGAADNIIPAAETLWMASKLPPSEMKAVLVSPVLSHLDIETAKPGVMDEWRLVHFFALVMRAAAR
jgi:pimeloyl-ACP methyl ester carboxylesterase